MRKGVCNKISYETKKEAKKELSRLSGIDFYKKGKKLNVKPRNYYQCPICKKWHLTSMK
jgi:hypothetical protein